MFRSFSAVAPGVAILLLAAGCAPRTGYPSLEPRPIEKVGMGGAAAPAATPAPVDAVDPAVQARIDALVATVEKGDAAFAAERDQARAVIARAAGAAQGGDAWVAAQQAYSNLDASRSPVAVAQADLDAIQREQLGVASPATLAAIDAGRRRIDASAEAQQAALAELAAGLP